METKKLETLNLSSEEIFREKILKCAKDLDYDKYTSTLMDAWRVSIAGLSEALFKILDGNSAIHEGPIHRSRAISLAMSLGFMKYYYQTYIDFMAESDCSPEEKKLFSKFSGFILCDENIHELKREEN